MQMSFHTTESHEWDDPLSDKFQKQKQRELREAAAVLRKHGQQVIDALRAHYWASAELRQTYREASDSRLILATELQEQITWITEHSSNQESK